MKTPPSPTAPNLLAPPKRPASAVPLSWRESLTRLGRVASLAVLAPICFSSSAMADDPEVSPYAGAPGWQESKAERLQWFNDAKFGMFIHWGLYSPAGGYWPPDPQTGKKYPQHYSEWLRNWAKVSEPEYGDLTKPLFQPDPGCTEEWAKLAKDAGMKYAVLTAKHHDGYTLFNSKADYSQKNDVTGSTNISPPGRDLVAEYADSIRKHGLKVGYYYSVIDWQHPHATPHSRIWPIVENADHRVYTDYMFDHIKQLFTDYGRTDIIWADYSNAQYQGSTWRTKDLLTEVHKIQPEALTNNRFWSGLENDYGDFFTPEKYVPPTGFPGRAFEVCHTMNESFGYSHHDNNWKTTKEVVHLLADIVSKGGNLLLNVGPDAKGHIPEGSARVLRETGQWLETHGDAIYGTDATPFAKLNFDGRCTSKIIDGDKTNLYFHLFSWPADQRITLPVLDNDIVGATLMGTNESLKTEITSDGVVVHLPTTAPSDICPVVTLQINGKPQVNELLSLPQQRADRSVLLPAAKAVVHGKTIHIAPKTDNQPEHISHWATTTDYAEFSFNVTSPGPTQAGGDVTRQPGQYTLTLRYAAEPEGGGELKVSTVNNQTITAVVPPTGGWQKYKEIQLGEITLSEAGEVTIKLESTKAGSAGFINVVELKLDPVN